MGGGSGAGGGSGGGGSGAGEPTERTTGLGFHQDMALN